VVLRAPLLQLAREEERHDFAEPHGALLVVGERRDVLAVDEVCARRQPRVHQRSGAVADGADDTAALVHGGR